MGTVFVCFCLALLGLPSASAEHHETEQTVNYNLDIRPILADNCYACHGLDAKARQANLRLDTKSGAFSEPSGYPVIVPGKPEESELHLRIVSNDDLYRMPPADFNKTLTPAQIEAITQWIREGATWEEHWAFTTPTAQRHQMSRTETGGETPLMRSYFHVLKKKAYNPQVKPINGRSSAA